MNQSNESPNHIFLPGDIHETANTEVQPIPTEREWFNLFTRVAVALEESNITSWLTDDTPVIKETDARNGDNDEKRIFGNSPEGRAAALVGLKED